MKSSQKCANRLEEKKAGQRMAGLGKVAWRKTLKGVFFSAKKEQETAFNVRSAMNLR